MFVGRSNLVDLVEQLVLVDGRPPVGQTPEPPVLVIEGYGGTGRSAFLDTQAAGGNRTPRPRWSTPGRRPTRTWIPCARCSSR
nr:hypothetical protein GCM10017745_48530 [Saccharothrix mutabilis subsp. capreolus]